MGITDRRERERVKRRNAIVDAAESLFFSKGIANTSMDEIAEAVELSKGTIYLYFKSKEELYCAIIQRAMDVMKTMMQEGSLIGNNGLERMYSHGVAFFKFYKSYPNYFAALFHRELNKMLPGKENPLVENILMQGEELFESAVEVIKMGIADGSMRPELDPYKTALSLDGIFSGLLRVVSLEEDHLMKFHHVTSEELIHYSLDLIGHALANTGYLPNRDRCQKYGPAENKEKKEKKPGRKKSQVDK